MLKLIITLFLPFLLSPSFSATDPSYAYRLVTEGKAVLVDVREKEEIKAGMIAKAIWFPKSRMESGPGWKEDFVEQTKGKKIFLYCRSGKRSTECQELLRKNGINAESIGGYEQLKASLPTTKPEG